MASDLGIEEVRFADVLPAWRKWLWPNGPAFNKRGEAKTKISPVSVYTLNGGKDFSIRAKATPRFFATIVEDVVIATSSGFFSEENVFRMRGIWVHPDFRRKGLARIHIENLCALGDSLGAVKIWGITRQASFEFYRRVGFHQASPWYTKFPNGPHCNSVRVLRK
jgi:ribosomal protein S18 acetylase RimI-like enzyme